VVGSLCSRMTSELTRRRTAGDSQLLLSGTGEGVTLANFRLVTKFEDKRGPEIRASDPHRLVDFKELVRTLTTRPPASLAAHAPALRVHDAMHVRDVLHVLCSRQSVRCNAMQCLQVWAALGLMDSRELLKLADFATAHMTVLKTLTINLVRTVLAAGYRATPIDAHATRVPWQCHLPGWHSGSVQQFKEWRSCAVQSCSARDSADPDS
jgi:hypothetical protein